MNYETLTEEQRDALQKFANKIIEVVKTVYDETIKFIKKIKNMFGDYIARIGRMEPRKRYKALKSLGIKNYEPFFKRERVIRCRGNC